MSQRQSAPLEHLLMVTHGSGMPLSMPLSNLLPALAEHLLWSGISPLHPTRRTCSALGGGKLASPDAILMSMRDTRAALDLQAQPPCAGGGGGGGAPGMQPCFQAPCLKQQMRATITQAFGRGGARGKEVPGGGGGCETFTNFMRAYRSHICMHVSFRQP